MTAPPLPRLTLSQLAGQRVVYSYPGLNPPPALFTRIRQSQAAGVIFFGENIRSRGQIAAVIRRLQAARLRSRIRTPLLMMTDQEGGIVRRLPGAPVLSAKQMGEASDGALVARRAGSAAGVNLRGAGVNVDLAPVLDVFRQPGDFIDQFQRSFSSNPFRVASLAGAFITALQRAGVAATTKHFPGLGAATASQNTDLGPVTLALPLGTLRNVDMRPYPAAIRAGVELAMASWAVYPALDPSRPAGLSTRIVQGQLRGRLGFRGVTITDAMEAGALQPFGSIGRRTLLAAHAGMDLLLFSARDIGEGNQGLGALTTALARRALRPAAFHASVARILELRADVSRRGPLPPP
ncbi:MAG: glycoside hydrolase family 3 protein [Solirubrobacteraceae bacterium]